MKQNAKILFLGAHPDDVELNCLGSILKWQDEYSIVPYLLVCTRGLAFSRKEEQNLSSGFYGVKDIVWGEFEDGNFVHNLRLVSFIEENIIKINPDFVFTHVESDYHQDHIAVSKSTVSALRHRNINLIFYPSITNSLFPVSQFNENLYVDITNYFQSKIKILSGFKSQRDKYYFSKEFLGAQMKRINQQKETRYYETFKIGRVFN